MGWKASKEHENKGKTAEKMGSGTHTDVYHTDDKGDRDQSRSTDLHISGPSHEPSMRDVYPPSSGDSGDKGGKSK